MKSVTVESELREMIVVRCAFWGHEKKLEAPLSDTPLGLPADMENSLLMLFFTHILFPVSPDCYWLE